MFRRVGRTVMAAAAVLAMSSPALSVPGLQRHWSDVHARLQRWQLPTTPSGRPPRRSTAAQIS